MTRKLFCLILALAMCFSLLAGCGKESPAAQTPQISPTPTPEAQTPATPPDIEIEPFYTRLSEEPIEALAPGDDYGALHPFVGEVIYNSYGEPTYTYGIFDASGRIVCDSVYYSVRRLAYQNGSKTVSIPMLGLYRGEPGNYRCSVASLDGSFVSPEYGYVMALSFGVVCAESSTSNVFTVYSFDGTVLFTEESRFDGNKRIALAESISLSYGDIFTAWLMDESTGRETVHLLTSKGEILAGGWRCAVFLTDNAIIYQTEESFLWGLAIIHAQSNEGEETSYSCATILPPKYERILVCGSGYYAADDKGAYIFDASGQLKTKLPDGAVYQRWGYTLDGIYYLADGNGSFEVGDSFYIPVDSPDNCPLIVVVSKGENRIINLFTGAERVLETEGYSWDNVHSLLIDGTGPVSSIPCIWYFEDDISAFGPYPILTDWSLEKEFDFPILMERVGIYAVIDGLTGEEYICARNISGGEDLYKSDGTFFAHGGTYGSIWNGKCVNVFSQWCSYIEPMGELIFRYPISVIED